MKQYEEELKALTDQKTQLGMQLSAAKFTLDQMKSQHAQQLATAKAKFDKEKESLLNKFKAKLTEVESAHQHQRQIPDFGKSRSSYGGDVDPMVAIHQEIVALRQGQHELSEQLRSNMISSDSHDRLYSRLSKQLDDKHDELQALKSPKVDEGALVREHERHKEHCRILCSEVVRLRLKCKRESGYRSDLVYQKRYLNLILMAAIQHGPQGFHHVASLFVISTHVTHQVSPWQKLRRCVLAVRAGVRLQRLRRQWIERKANKSKLLRNLDIGWAHRHTPSPVAPVGMVRH
jgi:chromosome segregation ATPase